MALQPIFEP